MARSANNPLLTGLRGRIGNLVIKQYSYGTVITQMPSYTKRKPTPAQKRHRDMFAAAVKYAKAEKLKHIMKHGNAGRAESQDIYHKSIQEFMLSVKRIRQNDVVFERPWTGLTPKQISAEMISLATSIVTGEYDKKQALKETEAGVKKPGVKKKKD